MSAHCLISYYKLLVLNYITYYLTKCSTHPFLFLHFHSAVMGHIVSAVQYVCFQMQQGLKLKACLYKEKKHRLLCAGALYCFLYCFVAPSPPQSLLSDKW